MLPDVNIDDKWLGVSTDAVFLDTTDTHRYTKSEGELGTTGDTVSTGESTSEAPATTASTNTSPASTMDKIVEAAGTTTKMIESSMNQMASFAGVSSENKKEIVSMVVDNINNTGTFGNIDDKSKLKESLTTACGNFDSSMFNNFGGVNVALIGFGLMSLLTSLLCMGVNSVVSSVKSVAGTVVDSADIPKMLTNGVDNAMTAMNLVTDENISTPVDIFANNGLTLATPTVDVESILKDISSDDELITTFENTSVVDKLLKNYNGEPDNILTYMDKLTPDWEVKDLATTANVPETILASKKNTMVEYIDFSEFDNIGEISKEEFIVLV